MESAWLAIMLGIAAIGALSTWICRTEAAQRIAERIGFGDEPEWKK